MKKYPDLVNNIPQLCVEQHTTNPNNLRTHLISPLGEHHDEVFITKPSNDSSKAKPKLQNLEMVLKRVDCRNTSQVYLFKQDPPRLFASSHDNPKNCKTSLNITIY